MTATQKIFKPKNVSVNDWKIARKKAELIKAKFLSGKPIDTEIFVNSKEFFELICLPSGQPMVSTLAKIKFAQNSNIKIWQKSLENKVKFYLEMKQYDFAKKYLFHLELINPKNVQLLILKALYYVDIKHNQNAWRVLCQLIDLYPYFFEAYYLRAHVLFNSGKNHQALEDINLFLQKIPQHSKAIQFKANLLFNLNKIDALIQFCKVQLSLGYSPKIESVLAKAYLLSNQKSKAQEVLNFRLKQKNSENSFLFETAMLAKQLQQESIFWKYIYLAKENNYAPAIKVWKEITKHSLLNAA